MSELDGLSEYERKRASIIAANKAKLAELMPFAMDDAGSAARKTVRPSAKRAKTEYAAQQDRPKRAVRSKARHPFSFPAGHFWPDPVPKIRKPERRPECRGSSSEKMSDRLEKSMYFNSMQIGDTIRVVKNTKCGHHDVTNKNPGLEGQVARIMSVPIYPSTWLAVELVDTGKVVKIRTSQMRPLDRQADGRAAPLGGRVVATSAPVGAAESPKEEGAGATDSNTGPVTPNKLPDDLTADADADAANGPLRGTPAKQPASTVPAAPASAELITIMLGVYTPIVNMKSKHGDTISEIFMELPSKEEYPDYYEIIEVPLGFEDIEKKIKAGGYPDLTALTADFYQVFANAHHYNESGSVVYNYATILKSNVTRRMKHARETLRYQKLAQQASSTADKDDETNEHDAVADNGDGGGGSDASDDDDDAPIELNRTMAPAVVVASAARATVPVPVAEELSAADGSGDAAGTEEPSPVAPIVSASKDISTTDGSTGSATSPATAAAESDGDTDDDDMPIDFNRQSTTSPAIETANSTETESVPIETEEENKKTAEEEKEDGPQVEDEKKEDGEEEEELPVQPTTTTKKRSTTTLELVDVDTIAIVNVCESNLAKAPVQKARKKSRKADKPYSRSTTKQNAQPVTQNELVVA